MIRHAMLNKRIKWVVKFPNVLKKNIFERIFFFVILNYERLNRFMLKIRRLDCLKDTIYEHVLLRDQRKNAEKPMYLWQLFSIVPLVPPCKL